MVEPLIVDPRDGCDPYEIPAVALVPLSAAHLLIAKARATVYRWVEDDRLAVHELHTPGKAVKQYVKAGDVREIEARMYRRGLSAKRRQKMVAKSETMR